MRWCPALCPDNPDLLPSLPALTLDLSHHLTLFDDHWAVNRIWLCPGSVGLFLVNRDTVLPLLGSPSAPNSFSCVEQPHACCSLTKISPPTIQFVANLLHLSFRAGYQKTINWKEGGKGNFILMLSTLFVLFPNSCGSIFKAAKAM